MFYEPAYDGEGAVFTHDTGASDQLPTADWGLSLLEFGPGRVADRSWLGTGDMVLSPEDWTLDLDADRNGFVLASLGEAGDDKGVGDGPSTPVDEVIVEGNRRLLMINGQPFITWGGSGPGQWTDTPGEEGGSGATGGGGDPVVDDLNAHEGVDCATREIRTAINNLPTNNSNEHVAIVFRGADGNYYSSPPFTGTNNSVNFTALGEWMASHNVNLSDVVVLYHNHPNGGISAELDRYPSNHNSVLLGDADDWSIADAFIRGGTDGSTFRLAVEDQSGNVRYFNYVDRAQYANMSVGQMTSGSGLPSAVGSTCETNT